MMQLPVMSSVQLFSPSWFRPKFEGSKIEGLVDRMQRQAKGLFDAYLIVTFGS